MLSGFQCARRVVRIPSGLAGVVVFASHEAIGGPDDTKEIIEDALGEGAPNLPEFLCLAAEGELEGEMEE